MRLLLATLLFTLTLSAQSFTERTILGVWQISSVKTNGFKMCKIEEMPTPTYQRSIEDYKF